MNVLFEAEKLTSGEREQQYGHPYDNWEDIAVGWSTLVGAEITAETACLMMVWVKLCREVQKPQLDNLIDGAGYLRLVQRIKDERERRSASVKSLLAHMKEAE